MNERTDMGLDKVGPTIRGMHSREILRRAEAIARGWREQGRTRQELVLEFGELLGIGPMDSSDSDTKLTL